MRSIFESLLRLYDFDGAAQTSTPPNPLKAEEAKLDVSRKDASTFPYLP